MNTAISLEFRVVLRAMRRRAGLTQKELADLAALSVRAVRDLESGRVGRPRKETIRLLAHALRLKGDRQVAFMAAAAPQFGDDIDDLPVSITSLSSNREDHQDEVQILSELLISERRRQAMSTDQGWPGGGAVVIAVARPLDSTTDWSVLWVAPAVASV